MRNYTAYFQEEWLHLNKNALKIQTASYSHWEYLENIYTKLENYNYNKSKTIESLQKRKEKSCERQFNEIQRKGEEEDEHIMKITALMFIRPVYISSDYTLLL